MTAVETICSTIVAVCATIVAISLIYFLLKSE